MRQDHAEEDAGGVHDRRLHAAGVGQADIEEDVLDRGLGQAQQGDLTYLTSVQREDGLLHRRRHDQQDRARQGEAPAGEQHLAGNVAGSDMQQGIAVLDGRIGAAPQDAAQGCQGEDA
jgi:hypothetical protein